MTKTPFTTLIRSQSDLEVAWRHLMGPWGFGGHSVWLMLISDDRPLPALTELTESEMPPDDLVLSGLVELLRRLEAEVVPGVRFAFLRSRPGVDAVTGPDRAWAATLYAACRRAGVACEVVHLATKGSVRPIPPDDHDLLADSA